MLQYGSGKECCLTCPPHPQQVWHIAGVHTSPADTQLQGQMRRGLGHESVGSRRARFRAGAETDGWVDAHAVLDAGGGRLKCLRDLGRVDGCEVVVVDASTISIAAAVAAGGRTSGRAHVVSFPTSKIRARKVRAGSPEPTASARQPLFSAHKSPSPPRQQPDSDCVVAFSALHPVLVRFPLLSRE